jgi:hypothetical protein
MASNFQEIDTIYRQLNFNNSIIDRLLTLLEQKQRQNTLLLTQLGLRQNLSSRYVNSGATGATGRQNYTQQNYTQFRYPSTQLGESVDVLLYFFPENVSLPQSPSREIIEAETSNHCFQDIIDPKNICCPITFEPLADNQNVTMINHCQHLFTTTELYRWFRTNSTCPVCRYNICSREYEVENREIPEPAPEIPNTENSRNRNVSDFFENILSNISTNPLDTVNNIFDIIDDEMVENVVNRVENVVNITENVVNRFRERRGSR